MPYVNLSFLHSSHEQRDRDHPIRSRVILGVVVLLATACSHALPTVEGGPSAPTVRNEPWRVPASAIPREPEHPAPPPIPEDVAPRANALTLNDVVDVALRNNPQTQISWAQARAAAANYGAATGAFVPAVDATTNIVRAQTTSQTGQSIRNTITPQVTMSYLLFDFGGRSGTVAAARYGAIALDLTHNATLQNVALQAEVAYFTFQGQRQLVDAARLTVASADTNLASARQRNQAGVATIADVLQAETQLAQAQLDLETAEGNLQVARSNVGLAMGVQANSPFNIAVLSDTTSIAMIAPQVDTLINRALALRPDLASLRASVEQAQAQIRVARSAMLPSLTLSGNVGKQFSNVTNFAGLNYTLQLGVQIPIFNLARPYNVTAAEAQAEAAKGRADLLRTQVAGQVYASYYTLATSTQRVATSNTLLASATRSEDAARERYRAGVGTIVELITAQTAVASARAQQAQARWTWSLALAQLSHDVGVLGPRGEPLPANADSTGIRR
jgi:outer membrane protein TolC